MDGENFFSFLFINFFLLFLSTISILSFLKQEKISTNGKSRKEIANEKLRNEIIQKSLSPTITVLLLSILICIIELIISHCISDTINLIDGTISIKALIFYSIFTLLIMLGLYKIIVSNGYSKIDKDLRDKGLSICILLFIFSSSSLHAYFILYFANYALDYKQGEMQIVTVSRTECILGSHSRKGSHEDSYEIIFSPNIRGKNSVRVSRSLFGLAETNDTLVLFIQEGALGLPYISSDIKVLKIPGPY